MRALLVIPARLQSTRLPRKPLLRETGKYLVQHVYERARKVPGAEVWIATDSDEVVRAARSFGAEVKMTSREHRSGTDRVAEAARGCGAEIVVNLQGDEPEILAADLEALVEAMERTPAAAMATLVHPRLTDADQENPSVVKAVVDAQGRAVDFRREPTPGGWRHLGVYAYRGDSLQRFCSLPPSTREQERRLEQMRALDAGWEILAVEASGPGGGIDTPEDYAAFVARCRR